MNDALKLDVNSVARQKNALVYLLVALVFTLLVPPMTEAGPLASWLLRIGFTEVLISAAVATRRSKPLLLFGLVVAFVAAPISWVTAFVDSPLLLLISCLIDGAFFLTMAVMILVTVIRRHLATIHSIYGAISSYLLLGLAWAVAYWGLAHFDDSAFFASDGFSNEGRFSQFVYFSFVTMSTLGFGDITPRIPIVQTLAWMQSVVGQFYIAVLVAWLVSEIPKHHMEQKDN
jgi:voltage-gated potassium channel